MPAASPSRDQEAQMPPPLNALKSTVSITYEISVERGKLTGVGLDLPKDPYRSKVFVRLTIINLPARLRYCMTTPGRKCVSGIL